MAPVKPINTAIVLTCSVNPSIKSGKLAILNPEVRLQHYVSAISKWARLAKKANLQIYIAENTNSIFKLELELNRKRIDTNQIVFFESNIDLISDKYGISAGEFNMLSELTNSGLLENFDFIWKCTGRLYVENALRIMKISSNLPIVDRTYKPYHLANTKFFGLPKYLWSDFLSTVPKFSTSEKQPSDNWRSLEHYFTYYLLRLENNQVKHMIFSEVPIFIGKSASTGSVISGKFRNLYLLVSNRFRPIIIKLLIGSAP